MNKKTRATAAALILAAGLPGAVLAQQAADPRSAPSGMSGRAAPHLDGPTGGGPEVHRPVPAPGPGDARRAPHLDNTTNGPTPHQPGPEPRAAANRPAPHLDNTTDGPTPHTGRH